MNKQILSIDLTDGIKDKRPSTNMMAHSNTTGKKPMTPIS